MKYGDPSELVYVVITSRETSGDCSVIHILLLLASIEYLKTRNFIFVCRYYHILSDSGPTRVV